MYANEGELDKAIEYQKKAFAFRDRVSERERFYIEVNYYDLVTEDDNRALQIAELWHRPIHGTTPYSVILPKST